MHRRQFLKAGAVLGMPGSARTPMETAAGERRRLENIAECNRGIRKCLRKHLITSYLPGQVCYNLGEYPWRKPWNPDEWDERHLAELRAAGVRLVQVHEEWNDARRLYGGNKLSPANPAGFRRFVDMVHRNGMKLIVYISTGFWETRDPDFRPEWARKGGITELYWKYARCSPASPGWRAYLLPRLRRLLDEWGVDGFYNDAGYRRLYLPGAGPSEDEVRAFEESQEHDGAVEDLLGLVYAEVKRRGGIVKLHVSGNTAPRTAARVYDYLWVGEAVTNADRMREEVKNHEPFVVPCLDMSRARIDREDDLYLHSIPYMQFPILLAGRPFTGERATISGIEYQPEDKDFWTRHLRNIWRYYQAHPDGPYSYGWWDSVPGRPEARPTYFKWLRAYQPMVEEGTWAYVAIGESDFFRQPPPADVIASAFANHKLYPNFRSLRDLITFLADLTVIGLREQGTTLLFPSRRGADRCSGCRQADVVTTNPLESWLPIRSMGLCTCGAAIDRRTASAMRTGLW